MDRRQSVITAIDESRPLLDEVNHWLFEHPEIGLEEFESSKYLCQIMRKLGFEVEEHLCGMETAFRATKKNGSGPRIALMAEYDALPGAGHACGHHLIAAMCVGAAIGLGAVLDDGIAGEVTVIGSPSEETGHGKPYLVDHGAYDGFDIAMSVHPGPFTKLCVDWIAIGGIDFHFTGRPAHAGATPYEGVNALDAVVVFYSAVNALRQQLRDGTRVHGIILEAGSAANIIPDNGRVRMEFRAKEQAYFDEVVGRVVNCAKGAALATGCELEYHHYEPTCKGVLHNRTLVEEFQKEMEAFGIREDDEYFLGSTDVGNVSQIIPTIHPVIRITEQKCTLHTPEFKAATLQPLAQERMVEGAKIMALIGLRALEDPVFLKQAKAELKTD